MATEKYVIDKSDLTALLRGEDISIQPKGNIKGFCVEIAGNLTNGDVIKAMFPDLEWLRGDKDVDYYYLDSNTPYAPKLSTFKSWWNAPYKAESEDK